MSEESLSWTFLSNYAHVLISIAESPSIRLRDTALKVDITERSAQRIINHLRDAGVLIASKKGRRNHYFINPDAPLRHPVEAHCTVETLLNAVLDKKQVSALRKRFEESQAIHA